ncbi:MAG: serine protease [Caulobacteraceae bacterium]|nr:serine protease [Caulobacteraceae bacterium]
MGSPFAGLEVEKEFRPDAQACGFDLNRALSSVVALQARVGEDAFTAETLGVERTGNGVVIGADGLVLTIGYLVTEADQVTLTTADGRRVPAHVLGVDAATGFGLVYALEPLEAPALPIGDSRSLEPPEPVIVAGGGGRAHALAGRMLARAPFSGYWEYHLDEALFVGPAHPHWSGAALINAAGELVGLGSLRMEQQASDGEVRPLNMFVPIELLAPIREDLAGGRPATPPRPWIGVFCQEVAGHVVVIDVSAGGPAAKAGFQGGDVIRQVGRRRVTDLAEFYKAVWSLGAPGVTAPITLSRGGETLEVEVETIDRAAKLRKRRFN